MESRLPSDNDQAYIDADLQYVSDLFLGERIRQKRDLGYTDDSPEFKDSWLYGELGDAAAVYALSPETRKSVRDMIGEYIWPWPENSPKSTPECRMRELVKAGGLLLHEAVRVFRSRFDDVPALVPDDTNYEAWYEAIRLAGIRDMMHADFLEKLDQAELAEEFLKGSVPVDAYKNLMY